MTFSGTRYVATPTEFDSVVFRKPTASEVESHRQLQDPDDDLTLFVWDAEGSNGAVTCYVLAGTVTSVRELVVHARPAVS